MKVLSDISLKSYNTFGMEAKAEQLIILENAEELQEAFQNPEAALVLGGGSNILFTKKSYPLVILNQIKGITVVEEDSEFLIIRVGSGEIWHEVVLWALSRDLGGIENLSLIPGTAGAAPIQNIGAYGKELKDVITGLDYYFFEKNSTSFMSDSDCLFGYRDSIFKNDLKGRGFVSSIYLKLKKPPHSLYRGYRALRDYLEKYEITDPGIHDISEAVIAIRQSKLPDWKKLGNAGSFFKNPVIDPESSEKFLKNHPEAPHYIQSDGSAKIPAAWLIQEAGFKGQRLGNAGSYHLQPLVLVNYGAEDASDVLRLKESIQAKVESDFGIQLIPEITII